MSSRWTSRRSRTSDTVVVKGRFTGKNKSGAVLDAPFEHRNTMRDGKVVRFENKVDQDAWAAAWT